MDFEVRLDLVAENLTRHRQVSSTLFGKPAWRKDGSFIKPWWHDCKAMRERNLFVIGGDQAKGAFIFATTRPHW